MQAEANLHIADIVAEAGWHGDNYILPGIIGDISPRSKVIEATSAIVLDCGGIAVSYSKPSSKMYFRIDESSHVDGGTCHVIVHIVLIAPIVTTRAKVVTHDICS